jgi:uncharacterized membrane protein
MAPVSTATEPASPEAAAARMPNAAARATRALTIGAVLLLIALGLAWELWLARTGSGTWAIKVLPLLPALPGLWRYRLYTYRWLSLLIWLYAGEGLVRATSEAGPAVGLAWAEVALALIVFGACVMHVRSRLRAGAPASASA